VNSTSIVNNPRGNFLSANFRSQDSIDPHEAIAALEAISCCLVLGREDQYLSRPIPFNRFYWDFKVFYLGSSEKDFRR
jgi:hypothetical protein